MLLTFEPIKSHVYNLAIEEYRRAVSELKLIGSCPDSNNDSKDRSNFHCSKFHLANCVALLDNLYYMRQVECIDELPVAETITSLDRTRLKSLSDKLRELYFPDLNQD